MVLAGRSKLRVSKKCFRGVHLFVFVEHLCNRSPKLKTKNIKNYSSILAIVNHWNWLDDSPPLSTGWHGTLQKYYGTSTRYFSKHITAVLVISNEKYRGSTVMLLI